MSSSSVEVFTYETPPPPAKRQRQPPPMDLRSRSDSDTDSLGDISIDETPVVRRTLVPETPVGSTQLIMVNDSNTNTGGGDDDDSESADATQPVEDDAPAPGDEERKRLEALWPRTQDDRPLSRLAAEDIASAFFLAQTLKSPTAQFRLVVAGPLVYPNNQLGTVERQIFGYVNVRPDLSTLVASNYTLANSSSFGLTCRFVIIGDERLPGALASIARAPIAVMRPGALAIPWQAFNPRVHTERPGNDASKKLVSFIDAPNMLLYGDSFYMSTTRATKGLYTVGLSPNDSVPKLRSVELHFYDDKFLEKFGQTGPNMHNVDEGLVQTMAISVEITTSNVQPLTLERFTVGAGTIATVLKSPEEVMQTMREIIVGGKTFV